jgi:uncharacterized protein YndB with AHSA1/START domain
MTPFRITLILAIVAVIAFLLYRATAYQVITIEKKVSIQASKEKVFDMVRYLANFPQWSPFLAVDPEQKYHVTGTDGEPGAKYHWDGNKGKDLGYQEIVSVQPHSRISMRCDIQKPFVAHPTFDYGFQEVGSAIEVTQTFEVKSGLVDAFFMMVFGAKKEMEGMNQKGLDLLKAASEKASAAK